MEPPVFEEQQKRKKKKRTRKPVAKKTAPAEPKNRFEHDDVI